MHISKGRDLVFLQIKYESYTDQVSRMTPMGTKLKSLNQQPAICSF